MTREVVLVHSAGRSGTTWLADLLRQNTALYYKNEPFSPRHEAKYNSWLKTLPTADPAKAKQEFFTLSNKFMHEVDHPPFPKMPIYKRKVAQLAHRVGYKSDLAASAFGRLTSHEFTNPILIKDVWMRGIYLVPFVSTFNSPMISIARNPFARVASALRGEEQGVFGKFKDVVKRVHHLSTLLPDIACLLYTSPSPRDATLSRMPSSA